MNNSVLSERVGNYRINVYYSEYAENPRTDWGAQCSHMVIRSRYMACESNDVEGVITHLCEKYNVNMQRKTLCNLIDELNEFIVIKPISHYTHTGTTVYYGEPCDRFDSGICGFGYMEKSDLTEDLCKWNNFDLENWRKHCEEIMQGEMETFDRAVRGEVYAYIIEELREPSVIMQAAPEFDWDWWEADTRNWEIFDSCCGFYMGAEDVMKEAKAVLPETCRALAVA